MRMTGAQALIKSLENEGVKDIFGYPGGVVLPIYDALLESKLRHILVRHEQCAAHAADGYARATGKVGVCMTTSGPGATNLVTGIANAYMDSIPIVAITGQVATHVIGTDAFQEADITGITSPIVKNNYLVTNAYDLPKTIKEAFYIASTGRPGPVLIDIPVDISKSVIDFKYPKDIELAGYKPTYKANVKQIKTAIKLIASSKKPVLYAGGGITTSGCWDKLAEFAEKMNLPVTTTLMGKGSFSDTHPLSLGMPGMHGTRYANYALMECDCLIAIGVRFDDRVTGKLDEFARNAKIIHADIDPAEIGKNKRPDIPIVGDAGDVLQHLLEEASNFSDSGKNKELWIEKIDKWKAQYPLHYCRDDKLRPELVVEKISDLTANTKTIVTTGVGQNQMWAAQFYKSTTPKSFISSGGLGTMGYGLPAAIGAQIGVPDALVIDIDGDGSLQMVSQELATVAGNNLPIKIVVINNGYLGMVRQWQELFYNHRYSQVDLSAGSPDFVKLADAYGIKAIRIETVDDLNKALPGVLKSKKPALVDIMVEREECVYPMVAPGASIDEMLGGMPGDSIDHMIDDGSCEEE